MYDVYLHQDKLMSLADIYIELTNKYGLNYSKYVSMHAVPEHMCFSFKDEIDAIWFSLKWL